MLPKRTCAALATLAVTAAALAATGPAHADQRKGGGAGEGGGGSHGYRHSAAFARTATYPVFQNRPTGADAAAETVAEISAVSEDGRTQVYTDAAAKRIGFLDISDPERPKGLGTLSLTELGDAEDEPTSVTVVGAYALVVVNTSASHTDPSGRLDVISLRTRERVASHDLGGQPDSIALSKDKRYAAVAIENERDEEATPPGGEEGDLPQAPAGFVQIVDLSGSSPAEWGLRKVALTKSDGSALPALTAAGIAAPTDPEPEYVSVNGRDRLVVTLQENNGIVVIDLASGRITKAFSAGTASVDGIDTVEDGVIDQTGSITDVPREPDAVGWIDNRYLATANEGDWKGGTRGWTVFDSRTGNVVWDAGNGFEHLAARYGLLNEDRSENKGTEPEGLAIATYGGVRYAFVGSERSNFVAVYDISRPTRPRFRQILETTNGPEGLLPIPSRGLLAVSSEEDDAEAGVRASVTLFRLGRGGTAANTAPSLSSASDASGTPIGWGALSGLSAVPGRDDEVYAVTDAAYATTRVLTIDTGGRRGAVVTRELTVKDSTGEPAGYDAEGVYARPRGGFWLAVEGKTGTGNRLVRLDRSGVTRQVVALPADVAAGLGSQGFEGVTATTDARGHEIVWATLQREVKTDPSGVVRLGRYDVAAGTWSWYGYRTAATTTDGDWIGLSEITVVGDRLAVVERDKLGGPAAKTKKIYTVPLPRTAAPAGTLPVLPKSLAHDVLPDLRATHGWTQEKLEGLTVAGNGRVYAVTDNDGLDDSTGETVFLDLGRSRKVLGR
ncbi:esterase-like activity of phytase family protein [Streptomyces sp. AC512_CC834]|uniref:esterase-like activity of phytase family protein n=1 Tax=Streptomyces sp. AC512_CC834 TaxID=2823691 RepID=UPI001C2808C4|nr:esterase-like activity of phytase family protein [Streptomyces sp. AC512_CC834]